MCFEHAAHQPWFVAYQELIFGKLFVYLEPYSINASSPFRLTNAVTDMGFWYTVKLTSAVVDTVTHTVKLML